MKNSLDRKNLYLNNWNYNAALILTELENIVINNGGKLCTTWDGPNPPAYITKRGEPYEVINRTLYGAIQEKRAHLDRLQRFNRSAGIPVVTEEINRLEAIDNAPKKLYYGEWHYISFIYNNDYYYYQLDDNPFFDFHYSKRPIENGNKINRNFYGKNDDKTWWTDNFWRWGRTTDEIKTAAQSIFEMLTASKYSTTYHDSKRKQYTTIYFMED